MESLFYFAWVDEDETDFADEHIRNDEQVLSASITQTEGDFARLEVEIINPRMGLLAPGRKIWAWLSERIDESSESESEGESESEVGVRPLFFGRLVGVPEDINADTVTLAFIARPRDYNLQKTAVAETLKVAPYWDPIWFNPDTVDDPDNTLESRPALWHIDPVTHVVSSSHIITGEDGTLTFGGDEVFADSVHVAYGQPPAREVNITASVSWDQKAKGALNISQMFGFGASYSILTYTAAGLLTNWPKAGAGIGGGWKVRRGEVKGGGATPIWGYMNSLKYSFPPGNAHHVTVPEWATPHVVLNTLFPAHVFQVPLQRLTPTLEVEFDVSRSRSESVVIGLQADVQDILTDPEGAEVLDLSFSSSEIVSPVDPGGVLPLRRASSRAYFSTDRGAQSLEYLIAVGRAQLLMRARTVEVSFEVPWSVARAKGVTLRKSAVIEDPNIPGGIAAGKIVEYAKSINGDTGDSVCLIKIACTIGRGNTVTADPGEAEYVETDYVTDEYQVFAGGYVMPLPGEIAYQSINGVPPTDDGVDFDRITSSYVLSVTKTNSHLEQAAAMGTKAASPNDVFTRLNTVPTTFELQMRPLTGGPFHTNYEVHTTTLSVPKTIDLEAESNE